MEQACRKLWSRVAGQNRHRDEVYREISLNISHAIVTFDPESKWCECRHHFLEDSNAKTVPWSFRIDDIPRSPATDRHKDVFKIG